jgi:predicted nucleic acid-binding protein
LPTSAKPRGVILDAGPLIALAHRADADHARVRVGFEQLADGRTRLIAPLPIVFEVYKWLLYHAGSAYARDALTNMRAALEVIFPSRQDFDDATSLIMGLRSGWTGTLEDALVAALGARLRLPVWTLNYRDFSAFRRLELWTAAPKSW